MCRIRKVISSGPSEGSISRLCSGGGAVFKSAVDIFLFFTFSLHRWKTCAARRGLAAQVLRPENQLFVPAAINLSRLHISSWFATEQPLLDGEPTTGTSGW